MGGSPFSKALLLLVLFSSQCIITLSIFNLFSLYISTLISVAKQFCPLYQAEISDGYLLFSSNKPNMLFHGQNSFGNSFCWGKKILKSSKTVASSPCVRKPLKKKKKVFLFLSVNRSLTYGVGKHPSSE